MTVVAFDAGGDVDAARPSVSAGDVVYWYNVPGNQKPTNALPNDQWASDGSGLSLFGPAQKDPFLGNSGTTNRFFDVFYMGSSNYTIPNANRLYLTPMLTTGDLMLHELEMFEIMAVPDGGGSDVLGGLSLYSVDENYEFFNLVTDVDVNWTQQGEGYNHQFSVPGGSLFLPQGIYFLGTHTNVAGLQVVATSNSIYHPYLGTTPLGRRRSYTFDIPNWEAEGLPQSIDTQALSGESSFSPRPTIRGGRVLP